MKISEKYILNLILSILLVFSLLGTVSMSFVKNHLLNETTYIENYERNNISQKAYDEINTYFTNSTDYSRIPADVYMSAISEEDIKSIINLKIQWLFDYISVGNTKTAVVKADYKYDYSALEKSITDYFDKFASENNVAVDDSYNAQLQNTIDTAVSEIENYTDIYLIDLIEKTGILSKVRKYYDLVDVLMYICIAVTVLCIVLISVLSRKRIANILYWLSLSGICMSIITLIPTLWIKLSGVTNKLIIRNKCVYAAYTGLLSDSINSLLTTVMIILGISAAILIIAIIISKFTNKKKA